MTDLKLVLEIEHILNKALFNNTDIRDALTAIGITQEMRANKRGLFRDARAVEALQGLDKDDPLKEQLLSKDSSLGINRHQGNAAGGNQFGKLRFLEEVYGDLVDRLNASATLDDGSPNPEKISVDEFRYAAYDALRFADELAQGKIKDAQGNIMGVMGNTPYQYDLLRRFYGEMAGTVNPADPNGGPLHDTAARSPLRFRSADSAAERAEIDDYIASLDTTTITDDRFKRVMNEEYLTINRQLDLLTAEQYNAGLKALGDQLEVTDAQSEASGQIAQGSGLAEKGVLELTAEDVAQTTASLRASEKTSGPVNEADLTKLTAEQRQILSRLAQQAANTPDTLADVDPNALRLAGRSVQLQGVKAGFAGGALGDTAEFLNGAYEPFKVGVRTGNWAPLLVVSAQYGASLVTSAIMIGASVALGGVLGGPAVANFIGAGWAGYGIADGLENGAQLLDKIAVDLGIKEASETKRLAPKDGDPDNLFVNGVQDLVLANAFLGQLGEFPIGAFQKAYRVDDTDLALPDLIQGQNIGELFYGAHGGKIYGNGGVDEIYHFGYGEARGGAGNDVVIGGSTGVLAAGSVADPYMQALADARREANAKIIAGNPARVEAGLLPLEVLPELPDSPLTQGETHLLLDGGAGNDIVFAAGGSAKTTTVGGKGRDLVINRTAGGILYGDTIDGLDPETGTKLEDSKENSDTFWYYPGTTIVDAGHFDVLKFYGIPLTGGDAAATAVALAVGATIGGLTGAIGIAGAANLAAFSASIDPKTGKADPTRNIYYDHLVPWIKYKYEAATGDLLVSNVFDDFLRLVTGPLNGAPIGVQRIKNFDFVGSYLGAQQIELGSTIGNSDRPAGTLNMVFKAGNPLLGILAIVAPFLGAVGYAFQALALADSTIALTAAVGRSAKALDWAAGSDPLIIDLDGDGIETIGLSDSRAYFDVDGDLFREKTGWLKGDDGFLVLDGNKNGRVDDISELFGNADQLGYAELAAYDSNGDGKISVADLIWSELQVWQDRDGDGESDAGELSSLTALGIRELSLGATPLNATTPQGTELLSYGSVSFADGRVSTMYEAIFASNDTDTKYAGESGLAPWQVTGGQSASTLNAKGFGTITDLALPDLIQGQNIGELFYGAHGGKIYGNGGVDEIYHFGYGEARDWWRFYFEDTANDALFANNDNEAILRECAA
jgi:hypothetical protein